PLISPLYGDFTGLPPTQLVTGTRDMFLSDTARTHRKLRGAGVEADLNVYEALSHAEYLMVQGSPESKEVADDLSAFLVKHLP
ncbi:MAG: alpha/beta hydrolase, partial [Acidobacteriota bacterium]